MFCVNVLSDFVTFGTSHKLRYGIRNDLTFPILSPNSES